MSAYERVRNIGYAGAAALDLLAVALARREDDVSEPLARQLFERKGTLRKIAELSPQELRDDVGLEPFEAARFLCAVHIGRKIGMAGKGESVGVDMASDIAAEFDYLRHEQREHFCAVFLDAKNFIMRVATIHIGTQTTSLVSPSDVFREAIREGAVSLVVVHNHPSGDPTPSAEDVLVTDRLVAAGKLLDVPLLDHIIIGERRFVSLRERGIIT